MIALIVVLLVITTIYLKDWSQTNYCIINNTQCNVLNNNLQDQYMQIKENKQEYSQLLFYLNLFKKYNSLANNINLA